jgi:hypothetical protein
MKFTTYDQVEDDASLTGPCASSRNPRVHSRVGRDLRGLRVGHGDTPVEVLDPSMSMVMIVSCVRGVRCGGG